MQASLESKELSLKQKFHIYLVKKYGSANKARCFCRAEEINYGTLWRAFRHPEEYPGIITKLEKIMGN